MPATLDQDTETFLRERGITRPNAATYQDFRNHLAVNPHLRPSYRGLPAGQIPPPDYNSVEELAEQSLGRSDGDNNGRDGTPARSSPSWAPEPGTTSFAGTRDASSAGRSDGQPNQSVAAQDDVEAAITEPTLTIDPVTGDITDDRTGAVISYGRGVRDTTDVDQIDTPDSAAQLDELMRAGLTVDDVIRGDATSQMPLTPTARIASMQDAIDQMLNPVPQLDPDPVALPTSPVQSTLPAPDASQFEGYVRDRPFGVIEDVAAFLDRDGPLSQSFGINESIEDWIDERLTQLDEYINSPSTDITAEQWLAHVRNGLSAGRYTPRQVDNMLVELSRTNPLLRRRIDALLAAQQ
jgi:hypothetical protein